MKQNPKLKMGVAFSKFLPTHNNHFPYLLGYSDILENLSTFKCGQFFLPFSFFDKFAIQLLIYFKKFILFSPVIVYTEEIPYTWMLLARYLHEKRISKTEKYNVGAIENGFPPVYISRLQLNADSSTTDGKISDTKGIGVSFDQDVSYSKAVGELLERGFLSRYFLKDQYFTTLQKMIENKKRFLHPKELNGFLPFQKEAFPEYIYTEQSSFYWTVCKNLFSKEDTFLPTQIVFWGYDFLKSPQEPKLGYSTTSGCGGYFTEKKAILSALYEATQRDAVLIYWLNMLTPKQIAIETIPSQKIQDVCASLREKNIEIHFLETTSDIAIPTFCCVMVDKSNIEDIKISFAPASGFSIVEVLEHVLLECIAVRSIHYSDNPYVHDESTYESFLTKNINKNKRIQMWRGKKMYERFNFFLSGKVLPYDTFAKMGRYFKDESEEYEYVLDLFRQKGKGYEVYAFLPKNDILMEVGYHVARVVVPKLIPLYLYENLATLDAPRIKEVPSRIGYTSSKEINPLPHPIP